MKTFHITRTNRDKVYEEIDDYIGEYFSLRFRHRIPGIFESIAADITQDFEFTVTFEKNVIKIIPNGPNIRDLEFVKNVLETHTPEEIKEQYRIYMIRNEISDINYLVFELAYQIRKLHGKIKLDNAGDYILITKEENEW
ncbi:MAG: hypothetical protein K0S32_4564 [Bacteroidetes bacterium]|nr:hypothetical protein [Bacteroidota bacterium]